MEVLRLDKKLPPSHRGAFWSVFIDAVDKELQNVYALISVKKSTFDIPTMSTTGLIEMSDLLGVSFDANIDGSDDFIRHEVEEIPFKIQYKDTDALYRSFARTIGRKSQIFVYFYKAAYQKIIRNANDPILKIDEHIATLGKTVPYVYESSNNFTGQVQAYSTLDSGMSLDSQLNALVLDNVETTTATNHIGFEYEIDRLIVKDSVNYCMVGEYFDYMWTLVEDVKRVKEVPHIGAQLNLICDRSHTVNTMTPIGAKVMTTVAIDSLPVPYRLLLQEIRFGTGAWDIPTVAPTALQNELAVASIFFDESGESDTWCWASAGYTEMNTNNVRLHDGSGYIGQGVGSGYTGVDTVFSGFIPIPATKPKLVFNVMIGVASETLVDDGNGRLFGTYGQGTIDYITGAYLFTMTTIPAVNSTISCSIQQPLPATRITEAGLYAAIDQVKTLVAYATFPVVEIPSSRFHLNLQFMIRKGTLA